MQVQVIIHSRKLNDSNEEKKRKQISPHWQCQLCANNGIERNFYAYSISMMVMSGV
jgi:cytochrome c-type biogenesis protein CcmH/NrfF